MATLDQDDLDAIAALIAAAQTGGDHAVRRTFELSGGTKVPGVQMSLVGVAGKVVTTGSDGVGQINTDDGTYTLRVTVPFGYESVADSEVEIDGADDIEVVTLVPLPAVDVTAETTALAFRISSQGNASLAGVVASARLIGEGYTVVGSTIGINVIEEATSDGDGLVTLILFRESDYDLSVQRTNGTIYKLRIRTSDQPTTNISTAIEV